MPKVARVTNEELNALSESVDEMFYNLTDINKRLEAYFLDRSVTIDRVAAAQGMIQLAGLCSRTASLLLRGVQMQASQDELEDLRRRVMEKNE